MFESVIDIVKLNSINAEFMHYVPINLDYCANNEAARKRSTAEHNQ